MHLTERLLSKDTVAAGVAVLLVYVTALIVWRVYFSPIAKFPGPKLAAATFWYEFYFDVIQTGQYTWQIRKMHQKYGPIVRINPYEVHIDDPEFYDQLYSGPSKKRDKWQWFYKLLGGNPSTFETIPHDLHRLRRQPLSPYFSKQSVTRLAPLIQSRVDTLCERFREAQKSGEPVNLSDACSALTGDIITKYSFGKSYGFLAQPDFASEFRAILAAGGIVGNLIKQFGWIHQVMQAMPTRLVALLNPQMTSLLQFENHIKSLVQAVLDGKGDNKEPVHRSIFHELLDSSLPPAEKSPRRLAAEAEVLVAAGTYTTAHVLATTSFHILANPEVLRTLKIELASAIPESSVSLQKLEQLRYLSAIISEGLRISNAVSSRLPRISPDNPIIFKEWTIPSGTPMSMTPGMMHENPRIFPEPHEFRPDRWLQEDSEKRLRRYLVPFSKGTRVCLGMNLANAELHLTLAALFRRFDLELYETTREDVDVVIDALSGVPRLGSKGVRVLVK